MDGFGDPGQAMFSQLMNLGFMRPQSGQFSHTLEELKSGDDARVLQAIQGLSSELSMAQENILASFPLDSFVPVLIDCMQREAIPDIMFHAIMCITHLIDVIPAVTTQIVEAGAVDILAQRVQNFEYIDVAESAIKALEKISTEDPHSVLTSDCMSLIVNIMDFFENSTQRLVLNIAVNLSKNFGSSSAFDSHVSPLLPPLANMIRSGPGDQHNIKLAIQFFSGLVQSIQKTGGDDKPKITRMLEATAQNNLIERLFDIVSVGAGEDILPASDLAAVFAILRTLCEYSPTLTQELLNMGVISMITSTLEPQTIQDSANESQEEKNMALVYENIALVNSLLPPVQADGIFIELLYAEKSKIPTQIIQAKEKIYKDNPSILDSLAECILPSLTKFYESYINMSLRYHCLYILEKLIFYTPAETLEKLLKPEKLSAFLQELLNAKDCSILCLAMRTIEYLLKKLRRTFMSSFIREGVIKDVHNLSNMEYLKRLEDVSSSNRKIYKLKTPSTHSSSHGLFGYKSRSGRFGSSSKREKTKIFSTESNLEGIPEGLTTAGEDDFVEKMTRASDQKQDSKSSSLSSSSGSKSTAGGLVSTLSGGGSGSKKSSSDSSEKRWKGTSLFKSSGSSSKKAAAARRAAAEKLREQVQKQANHLVDDYFNQEDARAITGASQEKMEVLKLISDNLAHFRAESLIGSDNSSEDSGTCIPLDQLAAIFESSNSLTIYEFCSSGIVEALVSYFSFGSRESHFEEVKGDDQNDQKSELQNLRLEVVSRVEMFIIRFYRRGNSGKVILEEFLKLLIQTIARVEKFQVDLFENSVEATSGSNLYNALRALSNRVRITLKYDKTFESSSNDQDDELSIQKAQSSSSKVPSVAESTLMESSLERSKSASSPNKSKSQLLKKHELYEQLGTIPFSVEQFSSFQNLEHYILHKLCLEDFQMDRGFSRHFFGGRSKPSKSSKSGSSRSPGKSKSKGGASSSSTSSTNRRGAELLETLMESMMDLGDAPEEDKQAIRERLMQEMSLLQQIDQSADRDWGQLDSGLTATSTSSLSTEPSAVGPKDDFEGEIEDPVADEEAQPGGLPALDGEDSSDEGILDSALNKLEIVFFFRGERIPKTLSIFEMSQKFLAPAIEANGGSDNGIFIDFKLIEHDHPQRRSILPADSSVDSGISMLSHPQDFVAFFDREISIEIPSTNPAANALKLIKILHFINENLKVLTDASSPLRILHKPEGEKGLNFSENPQIPEQNFMIPKLTTMLKRQISDPLALSAGMIPEWCKDLTIGYSFIFDFEARLSFFRTKGFGVQRGLNYIINQSGITQGDKSMPESRLTKLTRQKIQVVSRDTIVDEAIKIMKAFADEKRVLEFEFKDEEGTGLGPTLEYYSTFAQAIKSAELKLWRQTSDHSLFPAVALPKSSSSNATSSLTQLSGSADNRLRDLFRCIGAMTARSLLDDRLIDLPFSRVFLKLILDKKVTIFDLCDVDRDLGTQFLQLQDLANKKKRIDCDTALAADTKQRQIESLKFKGAAIEDLGLDFTLPGYEGFALKEGGKEINVDIHNLQEYIERVLELLLLTSVETQVAAFQSGFEKVFPLHYLNSFNEDEIEGVICGHGEEDWDEGTLLKHIVPNYGYTRSSDMYLSFIRMLTEFNHEERRKFLTFTTGGPRLPIGGFKNLHPNMTLVKKPPEFGENSDFFLPSVMTCQNYIKLPEYSSYELMKKQFEYAYTEGSSRFYLSQVRSTDLQHIVAHPMDRTQHVLPRFLLQC